MAHRIGVGSVLLRVSMAGAVKVGVGRTEGED